VVLVLASTSPFRQALLTQAGIDCLAVPSQVDEEPIVGDNPIETAQLRARAKAEAVRSRRGDRDWVIGADQVVHLNGRRFDKPTTPANHVASLKALRGQRHQLTTAVTLLARSRVEFTTSTFLTMRNDLTDAEIDAYVGSGEGRGCAGGYQIEAKGIQLFSTIDGCWTNILGLPVPLLITHLRAQGWRGLQT
jgi:septum formation protein